MKRLFLGGFFFISTLYGSEVGKIGCLQDPATQYPELASQDQRLVSVVQRRSKRVREDSTRLVYLGEISRDNIQQPAKKKRRKEKKKGEVDLICHETLEEEVPYFLKGLMAMVKGDKTRSFFQLYGGLKELGFSALEYKDSRGKILRNYITRLGQNVIIYEMGILAGPVKEDGNLWMFSYLKSVLKRRHTTRFIENWKGLKEVGIDPWMVTNTMGHSLLVVALGYKDFAAFEHMMKSGPDEISKQTCLNALKLNIEGMSETEKMDYRRLLTQP